MSLLTLLVGSLNRPELICGLPNQCVAKKEERKKNNAYENGNGKNVIFFINRKLFCKHDKYAFIQYTTLNFVVDVMDLLFVTLTL